MSPEALYYQRSLYEEAVYPKGVVSPLNTWTGKIYYGKIDRIQNTVVPRSENLVLISSATTANLLALNCVVEAFEEFVDHMKKATASAMINPEGNRKMLDVKASAAFIDAAAIYGRYMMASFNAYNGGLLLAKRNAIKDFETFVKSYVSYLKHVSEHLPVTKANFYLTEQVNILSSGLTIEIDTGEPEDDAYKYKNFINDPNFTFFVNSAKKFGLMVDKNIPWRLTFDLFSPAALQYINNMYSTEYGSINKDNFFPAYYTPTYLRDIKELKEIIVNAYGQFVSNNPLRQERIIKEGCDKFKVENITRTLLIPGASIIDSVLTDKYMSHLYLNLRHIECKRPFRLTEKLYNQLSEVYSERPNKIMTPLQNTGAYINLLFRDYIYSKNYLMYGSTEGINYLLDLDK